MPQTFEEEYESCVKEGEEVLNTRRSPGPGVISDSWVNSEKFYEWKSRCLSLLSRSLGSDSDLLAEFKHASNENFTGNAKKCLGLIRGAYRDAQEGHMGAILKEPTPSPEHFLTNICMKFHGIVRQLRSRHGDRSTLDVQDEYDVQDLLHALLRLQFDDVREEEWTPSYAGKSARVDFLLKVENTIIEVKMGRKGMTAGSLGDELIVDIERYQVHPNCKNLICFVYDPQGYIKNPSGVESDLSRTEPLSVRVFICPKS